MKKSIAGLSLAIGLAFVGSAPAVGLVNFGNSSSTLISAEGNLMPSQTEQTFYFAVFLAPSSTVNATGQQASLFDPLFQLAAAYNTNHTTAAGRMFTRNAVDVGTVTGFSAGDLVDFVIRGWSSNLGDTWTEARDNWLWGGYETYDGKLPWMGSSTVGNDLYLGGGAIPNLGLMGTSSLQVAGFTLHTIPEPSSLALLTLGCAFGLGRRRKN